MPAFASLMTMSPLSVCRSSASFYMFFANMARVIFRYFRPFGRIVVSHFVVSFLFDLTRLHPGFFVECWKINPAHPVDRQAGSVARPVDHFHRDDQLAIAARQVYRSIARRLAIRRGVRALPTSCTQIMR